jgi:hypothetical protein
MWDRTCLPDWSWTLGIIPHRCVVIVQVMETSQTKLGADHPSTLTSMANLVSTYRNHGRWKKAEELQAKELEMYARVLGLRHPDIS